MKRLLIAVAMAVVIALAAIFLPGLFKGPAEPPLDTTTHSFEVAGFYGQGDFVGELMESDTIQVNVTTDSNGQSLSQSIKFSGSVCQRVDGLGRAFFDGAKVTEPDAQYKVYVNGVVRFVHPMELGNSATLPVCAKLPEKEFVLTGGTVGVTRVELWSYVFSFDRGAGQYELLAADQAVLIA